MSIAVAIAVAVALPATLMVSFILCEDKGLDIPSNCQALLLCVGLAALVSVRVSVRVHKPIHLNKSRVLIHGAKPQLKSSSRP